MTSSPPRSRRIEVLRGSSKVGVVLATLLMLALGAFAFYGVFHQNDLGTGGRVIGSIIGLMFGGPGVACLFKMRAMLGRHTLVFDHEGLGYETSHGGVPFRVSWAELGTVAVSTATRQSRSNNTTLVRLDLTPVDATGFAGRHPEMAALRRKDTWRLPLGPNRYDIAPVAEALHDYAGPRDGGVRDDGRATGWTYT